MGPFHSCRLLKGSISVRTEYAARKLAGWGASTDQLTTSAKPLSFWDERHTITLLVYGQVTTIAEYYGVGVLAVAVIADCALGVLFLTLSCRLAVDCGRTTRSWPVCLRRLRVWFWYT